MNEITNGKCRCGRIGGLLNGLCGYCIDEQYEEEYAGLPTDAKQDVRVGDTNPKEFNRYEVTKCTN